MASDETHRPRCQFSVVALLAVFAGIAAGVGLCLTLAELEDATDTHSGWSSEVQVVDGLSEAVLTPVQISTDTGLVVTTARLRSLYAALVIEMVTLVAVLTYLVRRSRRDRSPRPVSLHSPKADGRVGWNNRGSGTL